MSLVTNLKVSVNATQKATRDLVEASAPLLKEYGALLQSGTATGLADVIFSDNRTIGATGNDDIDLAGSLTDALGATATFVKVKGIIVAASASNANAINVGGAASNGFITWVGGATHTVSVRPGGVLALFAGAADATGYAVTAGTGDLLRVSNPGGGSVSYDVIIVGTSA